MPDPYIDLPPEDKSLFDKFTDYIFDFDFTDDDLSGTGLAEDIFNVFKTKNPKTGKMEIDYGKLVGGGTGIASILGLLPDSFTQAQIAPAGYTVPVPKMTATRSRVPGTYDSTRRSGSGGQRYFTDTAYTKEGVDIPDQTAEIARLQAANLANPARETLPVAPTTTTTPTNTGSTLLSNYVQMLPTGQEQVAPTVPDVTIIDL